MDEMKQIRAPRALWAGIRAAAKRDGYSTVTEAVRHSMREYVKESEARAKEESK